MRVAAPESVMETLVAKGSELIERDRWSRAQLLEYQRQQLRELLVHATAASPYYRDALGPAARNGDVELERLPTLPKTTLVDEFDRIVTDPRLRMNELEQHVNEPNPAVLYLDRYRVFSTSGTSGLRALIVYSEEEFRSWVAASMRLFARIGVTPQTRLVAIGAPNRLHITRQLFAAFRAGRPGTPELSVITPLDEIVSALNRYEPEALLGYASMAAMLAQEQLEGRLRIAPRIVGVSAEVLTDEARSWIREAWNVQPTEVYASTEVLYLATGTPPNTGLHLYEDLAIVEVVDERNQPVPPGRPGYKVLVTNLVNRTQPLIRYELSDSVTLADDADQTDLPYLRIAAVDGRSDDILRFPTPGGGEVAIHPYRLRAPFATLGEVRQYQIVQDDCGLQVRIVTRFAEPRALCAQIEGAMRETLEAAGAVAPRIDVVPVAAVERESGHAAKLKLVKNLTHGSGRST